MGSVGFEKEHSDYSLITLLSKLWTLSRDDHLSSWLFVAVIKHQSKQSWRRKGLFDLQVTIHQKVRAGTQSRKL